MPQSGSYTFSANAMATQFSIMVCHNDSRYAEQAATDAFRILSEIETELSFFIPNSQVSRINSASPGETKIINYYCFECLSLALEYSRQTNGAFYPFAGFLKMKSLVPEIHQASELIELDNEKKSVTIKKTPLGLDLGGIGKGYAVEKIRQMLLEWEISDFLISGGKSSVYANGSHPEYDGWPVAIFDPNQMNSLIKTIILKDMSVGSSGTAKGSHIYNPFTGKVIESKRFTWITGPDAVMTECFSTAAIILGKERTAELIKRFPGTDFMML